jgi:hypothetical protein
VAAFIPAGRLRRSHHGKHQVAAVIRTFLLKQHFLQSLAERGNLFRRMLRRDGDAQAGGVLLDCRVAYGRDEEAPFARACAASRARSVLPTITGMIAL